MYMYQRENEQMVSKAPRKVHTLSITGIKFWSQWCLWQWKLTVHAHCCNSNVSIVYSGKQMKVFFR